MRIHLAGVDTTDFTPTVLSGVVDNCFVSYYYQRKLKNLIPLRPYLGRTIIDSGAHSFFASTPAVGSVTAKLKMHRVKDDPAEFMAAYLKWLDANADHYDYFVELDIGELVGQAAVLAWREQIVAAGLAEKCIICYHPNAEPLADFLKAIESWPSRYCALEGLRQGRVMMDYVQVVRECYARHVRVHGFAMVKQRWMNMVPFYSVDSVSYKASIMYGALFYQNGSKFGYVRGVRPSTESGRNRLMATLAKAGAALDFGTQIRIGSAPGATGVGRSTRVPHSPQRTAAVDARDEALKASVLAMQGMEKHYTKLWRARGIRWEEKFKEAVA